MTRFHPNPTLLRSNRDRIFPTRKELSFPPERGIREDELAVMLFPEQEVSSPIFTVGTRQAGAPLENTGKEQNDGDFRFGWIQ
jgi:hypothetical protein